MICTEMGVSCSAYVYVGMRGMYRVLVRKPDGKKPLGRSRCRWEDNIKMDLQEVAWGIQIYLAQDKDRWRALVNSAKKLRVP